MFVLVSALINKHSHFLVTMALQAFAAFFPSHTHTYVACSHFLITSIFLYPRSSLPSLFSHLFSADKWSNLDLIFMHTETSHLSFLTYFPTLFVFQGYSEGRSNCVKMDEWYRSKVFLPRL